MSAEKRWDIVVQWYRGEITDDEFFGCFWDDIKKNLEEKVFPTWEETVARKPLETFTLQELEAEYKFLEWGDKEFGFDDDGVQRMEMIQKLIWKKKGLKIGSIKSIE